MLQAGTSIEIIDHKGMREREITETMKKKILEGAKEIQKFSTYLISQPRLVIVPQPAPILRSAS